jgi:hypothetical protein
MMRKKGSSGKFGSGMMKAEESNNEVACVAQAVSLAQERFDLIGRCAASPHISRGIVSLATPKCRGRFAMDESKQLSVEGIFRKRHYFPILMAAPDWLIPIATVSERSSMKPTAPFFMPQQCRSF